MEWIIPTAIVAYVFKSYFDGFLKEVGKNHYNIKLKKWLKKFVSNGRLLKVQTIYANASKDKISKNNTQSNSVSLLLQTKSGKSIKLLFDKYIDIASDLAREWHAEQTDKQGVDYFSGHLSTVANFEDNWKEQVVGYLHDVAEDTPHSVEEIIAAIQAKSYKPLHPDDAHEIAEALNLLNSKTANSREEYIARLQQSPLATKVKLHDLWHNMDIRRIANPTEKDIERTKRYRREYRQVIGYLGEVAWNWDKNEV